MEQPIDGARNKYVELHQYQESQNDKDKENVAAEIKRKITIAIKEMFSREALYKNPIVLSILKVTIAKQSNNSDDLMIIARAFEGLEKYFLLLVEQPWKPEFKKIKTYGGFYRTKIKSVLPECDKVFQLAGYKYFKDTSLFLYEGPVNKMRLLNLAFDCKVSVTLCIMIAEHYNKVKANGISHADAVSHFLPAPNTDFSNIPFMDFEDSLKQLEINPPAIPKREPLINCSNTKRLNVRHESEMIFDEAVLFPPVLPDRSSFPIPANPHSHFNIPPNIPPLLSENIIPEAFVDEVLPDLQQGTSDEHILESWKALEQQQRNSKFSTGYMAPSYGSTQTNLEEKWLQYSPYHRPSATVPGMTSASGLTHPIVQRTRQGSMQGSIDEGIDCRSFYAGSAKFSTSSMHGPNPGPATQRLNPSYSPSFVDPGYKTGPPSENAYAQSSSYLINPQTIYHAPNILTDGQSPYNMRQASGPPPPIPSRTLKPSYPSKLMQDDLPDSSNFNGLLSQSRAQSQSEIIMGPTYKGGLVAPALPPAAKHLQLRDKACVSKANSLKYNGDKDPLHQHLLNVRLAHSMDLTPLQWRCKSCTAENAPGSNVCSVCSCSRIGPDLSQQPECGKTCKACPKCTFENHPSRTSCDVCGEKLQDRFTYV